MSACGSPGRNAPLVCALFRIAHMVGLALHKNHLQKPRMCVA